MDQWIEAQAEACGEAVDRHLAEGDRNRPAFAMELARRIQAAAQALPAQRKESMKALGKRLMDEAGPGQRRKVVGMAGGTVIREPRAQILHDLGFLFERIGKG